MNVSSQENLIPNPSFEVYQNDPVGWNNDGADFTRILKGWNSPSLASPDVYGPMVHIPEYWEKNGFGYIRTQFGKSHVGVTVFGCKNGKPHCREYIQAKLLEGLVPGQGYEFSLYLSPLNRGLRINNISVAFSPDSLHSPYDFALKIKPTLGVSKIIKPKINTWKKYTFQFNAIKRDKYIIIGNFFTDAQTLREKDRIYTKLNYAYYYIDQIELKKVPPIIQDVKFSDQFVANELEIDSTYILENIYFDFNKSTLLPKSYLTLSNLLDLLNHLTKLNISIQGHTDSRGKDEYNVQLSRRRAEAVYMYLTENGINSQRLSFDGYGERQPIAPNNNAKNRALNRRVVFTVLHR